MDELRKFARLPRSSVRGANWEAKLSGAPSSRWWWYILWKWWCWCWLLMLIADADYADANWHVAKNFSERSKLGSKALSAILPLMMIYWYDMVIMILMLILRLNRKASPIRPFLRGSNTPIDNKEYDICTHHTMRCSNVMKPFQRGSCPPVDFQQQDWRSKSLVRVKKKNYEYEYEYKSWNRLSFFLLRHKKSTG